MPSHPDRKHHSEILFAFGIFLLLVFLYIARDVLLLIYVSALVAVVMGPAIDAVRSIRIGRWQPGRGLAVLFVITAALGLVVLFFVFFLPPVFRDLRGFAADLPERIASLQDRLQSRFGGSGVVESLDMETLERHASSAIGGAIGFFAGIFGGVFTFFTALILTAYFALDGETAFRWGLSMVSPAHRGRLQDALLRGEQRVRRWLAGQVALMSILGISATLVFGLLGLPYFYALGVLAGALNIVPIIGPVISLVLAAIVAVFDSPVKLLIVLGFYLVYQQLENAVLTPKIMRASVQLPPLAVVVALAVGGAVAGILGALVAVPTAALVAVLADEYLVKKSEDSVLAPAQTPSASVE